jgi:anti-anti-sigma factor
MLNYSEDERASCVVVRFEGDFASQDDKELRALFVQLIEEGKTRIAADMTRVTFLDSIILGTLVWGMKNMREAGGDWRPFGLHAFVRRLFDITQLDKAFKIFKDEATAVASFES